MLWPLRVSTQKMFPAGDLGAESLFLQVPGLGPRLDRKFAAVRIFDSSNVAIPYVRRSAFKLDGFPLPLSGFFRSCGHALAAASLIDPVTHV